MKKNDKSVSTGKTTDSSKVEEKNAKIEISKVRKQIRTGITGGWRNQHDANQA